MKLAIVGYGFVGKAVESAFCSKYTVLICDPAYSTTTIKETNADGVIVCVPTPAKAGELDMSIVLHVIQETPVNTPILIKSTLSIQGWKLIQELYSERDITLCPEFLRAESAIEDFNTQTNVILGGTSILWEELFKSVIPNIIIHRCTAEEAIITKYSVNSFLALKVSYFNQIFDFCKSYNIDFETVRKLITEDDRINNDHSYVTTNRGWGGHCFPKDVSSFISEATAGELSVLETAVKYNNLIRKKI